MKIPRILAVILAGGRGGGLEALTDSRPKPTLPIGGTYNLIDVSLSNLAHSHIRDVWIVEQYQARRLNSYLDNGRPWDLDRSHGGLVVVPPFEGAQGEGFARGNADSLARQLEAMREFDPDHVLVLSADHLYRLNFLDVFDTHEAAAADLTIVTTDRSGDISRYGVVEVDSEGVVVDFADKPEGRRDGSVVTEVFLYRAEALFSALQSLLEEYEQLSDYGAELLPHVLEAKKVVAHELGGYWMDLGTLQSYWTANLQLIDGDALDLSDAGWPLLSAQPQRTPAHLGARAQVRDSFVAGGAFVDGRVEHSVVGVDGEVAADAEVIDSVLLESVRIDSGVRLRNCIVAAGAHVRAPREAGLGEAVRLGKAGKHGEVGQLGTAWQMGEPGRITLIGANGEVDSVAEFDPDSPLPRLTDDQG
ncbi:glucose-1-phosphate adenylyltransferase family protein [Brevibacterium daeguense]|uniref:Glucose-1-phosphate adenylyltransferase family protein n=1 Tax=Brevibacterium daeguense TaxID=909936 RepID=A0ABP8EHU7_9MICO|nr:sugar phosphate nucleotidyltransferase [Brevibacterium daeguense]